MYPYGDTGSGAGDKGQNPGREIDQERSTRSEREQQMDAMQRLMEAGAIDRLAQRDATLYTDVVEERQPILHRMGWIDLASVTAGRLPQYASIAEQIVGEGATDIVLLGMGGSSLASLVLSEVLGPSDGHPRLHVLDTTSPLSVSALLDTQGGGLDPATTWVIVSSKSGSTIEPLSLYAAFRAWSDDALGRPAAGRHYIAITDPGTPLEAMRQREVMRIALPAPANVGGRYSALSVFALAPASFIGIDVSTLVKRAEETDAACQHRSPENPAAALAAWMVDSAEQGRDKLTLVSSAGLETFSLWIEQLVAESLGKQGRGIVPVPETTMRPASGYGADRAVCVIRFAGDAALAAWTDEHRAQCPSFEIVLNDPLDIAREFVRWEYATALAGYLFGVNPFDEPDVGEAKQATADVLDGARSVPSAIADIDGIWATYAGGLEGLATPPADLDAALAPAFAALQPGDYLALLAYLPDDPSRYGPLRAALPSASTSTGAAMMLELGPRYLHSTGQLHKGGPDTGVFVIITARDRVDVPVPGRPFTLARLHRSQAEGDLVTLASRGRRVMRLDLPDSEPGTIARVADGLIEAARS